MKQPKDIRILLVEDNPDDVELTLKVFRKYNIVNQILVARDGEEALKILFNFKKREEDDLIKSYQLGVNSYIRKPVNFDNFIEVVRQLGLYWLILNEPLPKEKE
ncbi:hypothetical protein CVT91_15500 [Candidatus Atribacteria bacterium HGW-Atribacteria-1]|nr:MAG: hypothetical protein CVT91_15500 [Candidatus Atribacteria bacterium HGW-Atribacteria-1]